MQSILSIFSRKKNNNSGKNVECQGLNIPCSWNALKLTQDITSKTQEHTWMLDKKQH